MFEGRSLFAALACVLFIANFSFADDFQGQARVGNGVVAADQWLDREVNVSVARIFRNVSPYDARPGAVVAAQTRNSPNYYFHWVRDAALTIEALIARYNSNQVAGYAMVQEQQVLRRKIMEYFEFSEYIGDLHTLGGLGEPKFYVDGSAYNEPWGRPQNDGPALRALSLMHFAKILIDEGQIDFVRSRLYNARISSGSVIKRDLEFVSNNWRKPSFDLWEEVEGDHFYTRMVQRRALLEGADFANAMGDAGAAQWYAQQGREIERDLNSFWDSGRGQLLTTRNRTAGIDYKNSQMDAAIILGLLHGSMNDGFMSFKDYRVQATLNKMADAFYRVYPINRDSSIPGVAIGRYPEDLYAGANFNGGNPWVLTTFAFAEAYYRMAAEYQAAGNSSKVAEAMSLGDAYVNRVQYHSHTDGSLNEQIDRYSGYMMSVEDLTWNYASALTAYFARIAVTNHR